MATSLPATRDDSRRGWQALDSVLERLEKLASDEHSTREFFEHLAGEAASLGLAPVILWARKKDGEPEVLASSLEDESVLLRQQYLGAIADTLKSGSSSILPATKTGDVNVPKLNGPFLVAPWAVDSTTDGVIQAWLRADRPAGSDENYLKLLAAIAELVALHRTRQRQSAVRQTHSTQERLLRFVEGLHVHLELADVAYYLANDGRALTGCDRVAVVIRQAGRLKAVAVSGADHLHRRSEVVPQLETLCARVAATREPFWHDGTEGELPPQLTAALTAYLEVSPALVLAAIPLREPAAKEEAAPIAVLVFEQYSKPFQAETKELIETLSRHAAVAIQNAKLVQAVPGWRVWSAWGRSDRWPRWLTRTSILLVLLLIAIATLFLVPADVRIRAQGELQPEKRYEVFAPRDGVIFDVLADHGQTVAKDESLIVMRSPELDLELKRVSGELETTRKQLAATQAERLQIRSGETDARLRQRRLSAEEEQFQEQIRGLESRETLLKEQEERLTIRSPADGDVLTWNAKQRLAARPVRRGDSLLAIADPNGPWQVELRVPSRRAGRLLAAQRGRTLPSEASFVLTTDPGVRLQGQVSHVNERMEINEKGESYLLVTVTTPREQLPSLKPGATALARIDCGRGSLAEAWFHELLDAVWLWLA